jgi:hypothetical protein
MSDNEAKDSKPDDASDSITIKIRDQVRQIVMGVTCDMTTSCGLAHLNACCEHAK